MGSVVVRMRLFAAPREEVAAVVSPPWPRWMKSLYDLEAVTEPALKPDVGQITLSAAIGAVRDRLSHRLTLLAWVTSELEVHGWDVELDGDDLIASRVMSRQLARETLDESGIAGAMTAVAELDADGWPRLFSRHELRR